MPIKQSGYSHHKADAHVEKLRQEADARQAEYDALTLREKIKRVQNRGGSKRELERVLTAPVNNKKTVATTPLLITPVVVEEVKVEAKPKKHQSKSKINRAAKSQRPSKS